MQRLSQPRRASPAAGRTAVTVTPRRKASANARGASSPQSPRPGLAQGARARRQACRLVCSAACPDSADEEGAVLSSAFSAVLDQHLQEQARASLEEWAETRATLEASLAEMKTMCLEQLEGLEGTREGKEAIAGFLRSLRVYDTHEDAPYRARLRSQYLDLHASLRRADKNYDDDDVMSPSFTIRKCMRDYAHTYLDHNMLPFYFKDIVSNPSQDPLERTPFSAEAQETADQLASLLDAALSSSSSSTAGSLPDADSRLPVNVRKQLENHLAASWDSSVADASEGA